MHYTTRERYPYPFYEGGEVKSPNIGTPTSIPAINAPLISLKHIGKYFSEKFEEYGITTFAHLRRRLRHHSTESNERFLKRVFYNPSRGKGIPWGCRGIYSVRGGRRAYMEDPSTNRYMTRKINLLGFNAIIAYFELKAAPYLPNGNKANPQNYWVQALAKLPLPLTTRSTTRAYPVYCAQDQRTQTPGKQRPLMYYGVSEYHPDEDDTDTTAADDDAGSEEKVYSDSGDDPINGWVDDDEPVYQRIDTRYMSSIANIAKAITVPQNSRSLVLFGDRVEDYASSSTKAGRGTWVFRPMLNSTPQRAFRIPLRQDDIYWTTLEQPVAGVVHKDGYEIEESTVKRWIDDALNKLDTLLTTGDYNLILFNFDDQDRYGHFLNDTIYNYVIGNLNTTIYNLMTTTNIHPLYERRPGLGPESEPEPEPEVRGQKSAPESASVPATYSPISPGFVRGDPSSFSLDPNEDEKVDEDEKYLDPIVDDQDGDSDTTVVLPNVEAPIAEVPIAVAPIAVVPSVVDPSRPPPPPRITIVFYEDIPKRDQLAIKIMKSLIPLCGRPVGVSIGIFEKVFGTFVVRQSSTIIGVAFLEKKDDDKWLVGLVCSGLRGNEIVERLMTEVEKKVKKYGRGEKNLRIYVREHDRGLFAGVGYKYEKDEQDRLKKYDNLFVMFKMLGRKQRR